MQIFNDVAQFYHGTKTHSFSRFWRKLSKLGLIKVQSYDPVVELDDERLQEIEKMFEDIDGFISNFDCLD